MDIPEFDIDLETPPERRWDALRARRDGARGLIDSYIQDLGGVEQFAPLLRDYARQHVRPELLAEMQGIARVLDMPEDRVIVANLYYDAMKLVLAPSSLGCTAFGVSATGGPFHARNLDWWSADRLLATETTIFNYYDGGARPRFRVVGWPGFVGCFSGVAEGRFAVTLNAVLSADAPAFAAPITLLLRDALAGCLTYADALSMLRDTPVASDSLLLVTGTTNDEMAVVERAPTRAAVRPSRSGSVCVTNDYRVLASGGTTSARGELAATACARFDRASELVQEAPPTTIDQCFAVLCDERVRMGITVQHMVFHAASGEVSVRLPG